MSLLSRNLITGAALALIGASLGACAKGSTTLPNDPLQALVCDTGYILSVDRKSCIPETMIVVQGVVMDDATGQPISGINVTVSPMTKATTVQTDANGFWFVRGPTSGDDLLVTYSSTGYSFATQILRKQEAIMWSGQSASSYAIAGDIVLSTTMSLSKLARQLNVAGYVYAGDTAAVGASVTLYDNNIGVESYTATTIAGGAFSFSNVRSGSYYVRVYPFDEDGNGVTDYNFFSLYLGDISQQSQSINVSNIVIGLTPTYRAIQYTSFIGNPAPITTATKNTGLRVASANSSILLHFGAQVDPTTVTFDLRSYNGTIAPAAVNGNDFSAPLAITAAWSNGNTVLTLTPGAAFTADPSAPTGYVLRIKSLIWADGQVFISQTATSGFLEFWFDVSTGPTLLASAQPTIYVDPKEANTIVTLQTKGTMPDAFKCDNNACYVLAADGYPVGGYGAATGTMNATEGFRLKWGKVAGAVDYNVYVRRSSADAKQPLYANWYQASAALDVTPIDPALADSVDALVLKTSASTTLVDWGDLNGTTYPLGALGGGASLDIAVTSKDFNGFESTLDPTATGALVTLRDTLPAITTNWVVDNFAPSTDLGVSKIRKAVSLFFSEPMIAINEPQLSVANSGNVVALATVATGWNNDISVANTATRWDAIVDLKVRGGCTVTTTDAYGPLLPPPQGGQAGTTVAVRDPSILVGAGTTGTVFFTNAAGTLIHVPINITGVTGNVLTTAPFTNDVPSGSYACTNNITTGNVTNLGGVDATDNNIATVGDNSIFYPGESVLFYIPTATPATVIYTIERIMSGQRLRMTGPVTTGLPSGTTVQPWYGGEYGLRGATANLPIRADSNVTSNASVPVGMSSAFVGADVMVGDVCAVDLDGNVLTIGDRYFGKVTEVVMNDNTATGTNPDNSDYHVTLGTVSAPMRSIPNGSVIRHGISKIQCMGDSLAVGNSAATSGQISDTSANTGLRDYGDQFSSCAAGFLCNVINPASGEAIF